MRHVLTSALLLVLASAPSWSANEGGGESGVKLLYGFEPEEFGASADPAVMEKFGWKFLGKAWEQGGVEPGWRVKEHLEELRLPDGFDGPVSIYQADSSRDQPKVNLYRMGATQGRYARLLKFGEGSWSYVKKYSERQFAGLTAQPAPSGYHDIQDWFYQRYGNLFDSAVSDRYEQHDWSPYEFLRADFYAAKAPAVIAVRAFDASGPKIKAHYLGLRTALAVFKLPQEQQVTVDFPLGALARAAEMDLSKMMGFIVRANGYAGEAQIFVDNVRLVTRDAAAGDAKHPLVKVEGESGPYARPVVYHPLDRDAAQTKRTLGPVAKLGPVTVYEGKSGYSSASLLLGGSGSTYFQSLRRGCVAYDNERLLIFFGKYLASASFDGGQTWGGLQPDEEKPAELGWGGEYRGTASADDSDLYFLGTENCSSYHEGYGVVLRRLAMSGPGWRDDRISLVDQNLRKCPPDMRAWRLASGRIWATLSDGWGGITAKYSDDDGYTWAPCKDASLPVPRPFHEPCLAELKKPAALRPRPPEAILPWPATPVCGSVLLPYQGQIAALGSKQWQIHDGKAWGAAQNLPLGVPGNGSATVVGERILVAHGGAYSNSNKSSKPSALAVAEFDGAAWKEQTLEAADVGDAILTASGQAAFLFYVKYAGDPKRNEIHMRRWADGTWSDAETVAQEAQRINRLAAPVVSAATYAALWWDTLESVGTAKALRFVRIPNP